MANRMHRTQILLEPEQHRALAEIAEQEGRSIFEVVREMIQQHLEQREEPTIAIIQRRSEALERIREHKQAILEERGGKPVELDIVELINEGRRERDERNLAGLINTGD